MTRPMIDERATERRKRTSSLRSRLFYPSGEIGCFRLQARVLCLQNFVFFVLCDRVAETRRRLGEFGLQLFGLLCPGRRYAFRSSV